MSKFRICFILSHLPQGGAERQTLNLIKKLNPEKYEITLLIYFSKDVFYSEVFELPINLILNPNKPAKNKIIRNIKDALFLKKYLYKNNFDIIHTLLFHNGFWVRLLAPKKYYGRIVYSIRNNLKDCPKIFLFFEKIFVKRSIVVTNSNHSKEQFISLVGEKFRKITYNIYNGFEIERFINNRVSFSQEKFIIGTVGRQSAQKNQIQIVRAINKIKDSYPIHLYIIGDKTLDKSFEIDNYIKNNNLENIITTLGSQQQIEKFYEKFDIFILSSIYEGCPNVLFEALLAKCLCIVSCGANSDNFIIDGINGLVYDGSDEMLELKIKYAFDLISSKKSNEIIENGFNYAMNNFSLKNMVGGYEKIYQLIANS